MELGCGTGRVTIPIADAGADIVGLDSSPAMLAVARRKAPGSLTLVQADMRDFSLDQEFGLVIIPFRGFLSLLTVEDEIRALRCIQRHMAPGGRLAFNIFVPDVNMLVREGDVPYHFRDVTDPETGSRFVIWQQSRYDNHNQIINARVIIEELDEAGAVERKLYRDFQLRYIHRWEMQHLIELCGYEVLGLFGDFDGSPFDEASSEMVWVCGVRE